MSEEEELPSVVVTDKRRINAEGTELLEGEGTAPPPPEPSYLEDLQRLKAEFDNYRRRKEQEVLAASSLGQARLVAELLGVLDDVERARAAGELDPGFRAVAEGLEKTLTGAGLEKFGAKGDPFDPARHEALQHFPSADVKVEEVAELFRPGYLFSGRVLRPAQVVVAGPSPDTAAESFDETV